MSKAVDNLKGILRGLVSRQISDLRPILSGSFDLKIDFAIKTTLQIDELVSSQCILRESSESQQSVVKVPPYLM